MASNALKPRVYVRARIFVVAAGAVLTWINLGLLLPTALPQRLPLPTWAISGATMLLTIIVAAVGAVPGTDLKARLVFLRWKNPLPGSRAFEQANMRADTRISPERLRSALGGKFPRSAADQNATWYRLYKKLESEPSVQGAHFEYLLFRDLTWLSLIFFVASAVSAAANPTSRPAISAAIASFFALGLLFRRAASERGSRFVNTVLALSASAAEAP
jgi:hypothetical protein